MVESESLVSFSADDLDFRHLCWLDYVAVSRSAGLIGPCPKA